MKNEKHYDRSDKPAKNISSDRNVWRWYHYVRLAIYLSMAPFLIYGLWFAFTFEYTQYNSDGTLKQPKTLSKLVAELTLKTDTPAPSNNLPDAEYVEYTECIPGVTKSCGRPTCVQTCGTNGLWK